MKLTALTKLLDTELKLDAFHDISHNGLQLENSGTVHRICTGVDASLDFLESAVERGADMVIVHHGLSWGESLARITGANYKLLSYAMAHNLAIYAAHLPLDAHPTLGNNAQIADALKLTARKPFMDYHGQKIGFKGKLPTPMTPEDFDAFLYEALDAPQLHALTFGKNKIQTVGVCSGGAPEGVADAATEGLDAYITGEINLQTYHQVKLLGINYFAAGHYATERFGVRALGQWVATQTKHPVEFIDFNLEY